jgi:predicted methyltransferase
MKALKTPLALALAALLLAACDRTPEAPATDVAATDAAAPAADAAPADPDAALRDDQTDPLDAILAGDWRDPKNTPRDAYRHPRETLAFFGVGPSQRIIEISPGGGWYTEILAPLAQGKGSYVGVLTDTTKLEDEKAAKFYADMNAKFREKLAARADVYGDAEIMEIDPAAPVLGPPNSADVVLTFRNVHNWVMDGHEAAMFKAFYDVLRPGGVLGVTDHRAAAGKTLEEVKESGYLPEDYVIGLATAAGFVLEEKSEINANPADTKDHPNGVWTLPPTNAHDEADRAKYAAIGESDRMTLRFVKPAGAAPAPDAAPDAAAPPQ